MVLGHADHFRIQSGSPYGGRASFHDLLDFLGLEYLRSRLTAERRAGSTGAPHLFHRGQQQLSLIDRLKFQIYEHVVRVVDGLVDGVSLHACFASIGGVPVERGLPGGEILGWMFNPQNGHDLYFLLGVCFERTRRRGQQPSQFSGIFPTVAGCDLEARTGVVGRILKTWPQP